MRRASVITLTEDVRATLERWSRRRSSEARLVERARIVLLAAAGRENKDIALELGITRATVGRWRNRFAARGLAGIEKDAPRGGRPPRPRDGLVAKIIATTTQQKPDNAPRRIRLSVRSRNQRSTKLSHELLVGMKWNWNRG